jgi:hypothetical protein
MAQLVATTRVRIGSWPLGEEDEQQISALGAALKVGMI